MLYYGYERLFARFAAPRAASHRRRSQPEPGRRAVCGLGANHQAVSQSPTRDWPRLAKSDPRPSCQEKSCIAGGSERAMRTLSRCQARRTLPHVGKKDRHQGESCLHQSCQSCSGLDTKKTRSANLGGEASSQEETGRYQGHGESATAGAEPYADILIADGACATPDDRSPAIGRQ